MLVDARRDLSALAISLGFANHSHFTSVFRRQFGMTPTQFAAGRSQSGAGRAHVAAWQR